MLEELVRIYRTPCEKNKIVFRNFTKKEFDEFIDFLLSKFDSRHQKIFRNRHFADDKFWWVDEYSKTTYYRLLKESDLSFNTLCDLFL